MSKNLTERNKQLQALYLEYKKNSSKENREALLKFWKQSSQMVIDSLSQDSSSHGNLNKLTRNVLEDIQKDNPDMQAIYHTKNHIVKRNDTLIAERHKKLDHWSKVAKNVGKELGIIGSLAEILIKIAVHIGNGKIADAQRASEMLNNVPEPLLPPPPLQGPSVQIGFKDKSRKP